jgi:hypothetical protein
MHALQPGEISFLLFGREFDPSGPVRRRGSPHGPNQPVQNLRASQSDSRAISGKRPGWASSHLPWTVVGARILLSAVRIAFSSAAIPFLLLLGWTESSRILINQRQEVNKRLSGFLPPSAQGREKRKKAPGNAQGLFAGVHALPRLALPVARQCWLPGGQSRQIGRKPRPEAWRHR